MSISMSLIKKVFFIVIINEFSHLEENITYSGKTNTI